jgi:hypothetical protein
MARAWMLGAMVVAGALGSGGANAFTISSPLSQGCHEAITSQALRGVRMDVPNAAPLALTANEQALVDDVQFVPDPDMKDLGGITLLVSVRDNDLKGRNSADLTQLAEVHGDPNNQAEHCLRAANETEPGGSEAAVADCRAFILGRISQALDGLDATGMPDSSQRTALTLHLSLRGQMDALLPTYYVRMGQAIHAIQDSFSHTYRTPDGMKITVVLNWLALVKGSLVESRDGPAHRAALDVCTDPDPLRATRHALATDASAAVLRATLDPNATRDQKMTTVGGILDKYMSFSPGCTFDNQWCQAPESQYQNSATGCGVAGTGSVVAPIFALLAAATLARRRKWGLMAGLLVAGSALAQSTAPAAGETNTHAPPPPVTRAVAEPGPRDPSEMAWGAYAGVSGSVDNAAVAGTLGVRLRASRHWMFGLSGEWNPWIALNGTPIRAGVINAYGSAILRYPLAYENFNLRTTGSLGASYLLTALYGAQSGSIGLYGELSPLGLEWKVSKVFFLIINPLNFALPVPQLRGVPLTYPQYRFSVGLEISLTDLFSGRPQTRY